MKAYSRVKAAQKRALNLIEKLEEKFWTVPESIKERATREIPKNIKPNKAQAIIDNLSASTIRLLSTMDTYAVIHETEPITKGAYKSGQKIFDVIKMKKPEEKRQVLSFNARDIVRRTMKQIRFVMEEAPSRDVSAKIENRLWAIELHGKPIFTTNDQSARRAALLQSIISERAVEESVKAAEKSGYSAYLGLVTLYRDLVEEYGTNERGLAARQMKQFDKVLEDVGYYFSTDPAERQVAADVLHWLIEHSDVWDRYRQEYKLKGIYKQTYDSHSLLVEVSQALIDYPEYRLKILEYLIQLMEQGVDAWDILDRIEDYVEELASKANLE